MSLVLALEILLLVLFVILILLGFVFLVLIYNLSSRISRTLDTVVEALEGKE